MVRKTSWMAMGPRRPSKSQHCCFPSVPPDRSPLTWNQTGQRILGNRVLSTAKVSIDSKEEKPTPAHLIKSCLVKVFENGGGIIYYLNSWYPHLSWGTNGFCCDHTWMSTWGPVPKDPAFLGWRELRKRRSMEAGETGPCAWKKAKKTGTASVQGSTWQLEVSGVDFKIVCCEELSRTPFHDP